jgi:hypothetical protein
MAFVLVTVAISVGASVAAVAGLRSIHAATNCPSSPSVSNSPCAKALYKAGPVVLNSSSKTVASLTLSKGKYALWAKLYLANSDGADTLDCWLVAGTDKDTSWAKIDSSGTVSLPMQIVHSFGSAGAAKVQCNDVSGNISASQIKITALKVGTLIKTGS